MHKYISITSGLLYRQIADRCLVSLFSSLMFLSYCFHSEIQVNASHKLLISKIGGMALFDDVNSYYHAGEMYRGKVIPSYGLLEKRA